MMGFGFGMGFLGVLLMILFWGGIIAMAVWLITLLFPTAEQVNKQQTRPQSAQDILDARFARGELTEAEYRHMKDTIQEQ